MIVVERVAVDESMVYLVSSCQACGPKTIRYNQNYL